MRIEPVFLFDLDGTLVDSVYQHVLAWKEALDSEGVELSVWRIHRKIGMSGGLFTNQLERETGVEMSEDRLERLRRLHADGYRRMSAHIRPLAGRARTAGLAHQRGPQVGDRNERTNGDGGGQPGGARRRSRANAGGHARSGQICEARSRPVPRRRGAIERADRDRRCRRRQHLGHDGGGALPRARGRPVMRRLRRQSSFNRRRPFACTRIRGICLSTLTSSAGAGDVWPSAEMIIARTACASSSRIAPRSRP